MDVAVDITKTTIETERLLLRAWQEADINDFFEYASVPGVGEMAGWPHHESIDVSRRILQTFISEKNVFAISYKDNCKVIGSLGLHDSWANKDQSLKHLKTKDIGYVLSKAYWGKGLMPEAVSAVIRVCFDTFGLDAVTCGHSPANNQSKRVIEKCGFLLIKQNVYCDEQLQMKFDGMRYILYK